ncbi:MAG: hypothetical protein ACR2KJ_00145 [Jatrophihabitans sp.]
MTAAAHLPPGARVLWRSAESVQIELGRRAVVLDGVAGSDVRQLTGRGSESESAHRMATVLVALRQAGFSLTAQPPKPGWADPRTEALLADEITALSARRDDAAATVQRRRERTVEIRGGGRLVPLIATLLATAGIGRVHCPGDGDVALRDALPGGLRPADEGRRFAAAVDDAVRRAAPDAATSAATGEPDLVVLAPDGPLDDTAADACFAAGLPHLVLGARGGGGVVGPLVLPGRSSCLRCLEHHRHDRDPAWPYLAVQLTTSTSRAEAAELAVKALTAALGVSQALGYLDGDGAAAVDGTLEFTLPDYRVRRRSWPRHPGCGCALPAPLAAAGPTSAPL